MQKLENKTLQDFLERFIENMKYVKTKTCDEVDGSRLNIPFIISSLYQSLKNDTSDYTEFISDLERYSDYGFSIENSRNDYNGIIDVYIYLSKEMNCWDEETPNYDYLLSFTYDFNAFL